MRLVYAVLALMLASPAWAQYVTETATVEHEIEDYVDATGRMTHAIERKFLVMPDGTRLRLKGVNSLKTGDKVKVKKDKVRKPEKASKDPVITEAEIDVNDVQLETVTAADVIVGKPLLTENLVVVPVKYIGQADRTTIENLLSQTYKPVAAEFVTTSHNQHTFNTTILPWVAITAPTTTECDYWGMDQRARTELAAKGVTIPAYHRIQFLFPAGGGCSGLGGKAGVGGTTSWIWSGGSISHELGHNLGFSHARFTQVSTTGSQTSEYGGMGIMGHAGGGREFLAAHKIQRGWLTRTPITTTGTYRLDFLEGISSGFKSLSVGSYTVELRRVVMAAILTVGTTQIDMDPITSVGDLTMDVGQELYKPASTGTFGSPSLRIKLLSVDEAGGTVAVTFGDDQPPPPPPIDCVVSAWSAFGACEGGVQTRTRTVVTPPANGGASCPALVETQPCLPPPSGLPVALGCWKDGSPMVLPFPLGEAVGGSQAGKLADGLKKCQASPFKYCGFTGSRFIWGGDGPHDVYGPYVGTCSYMGGSGFLSVWQVK